jgi:hypothetical protein
MLTRRETTQLVNEYRREPLSAMDILLTCAAGLLMVIVLALIGLDIHSYQGEQPAAQVQAASQ